MSISKLGKSFWKSSQNIFSFESYGPKSRGHGVWNATISTGVKKNFRKKPPGGDKPRFSLVTTRCITEKIYNHLRNSYHERNPVVNFHCSQTSSWVSNFNSRAKIFEKMDFLQSPPEDFLIFMSSSLGVNLTYQPSVI